MTFTPFSNQNVTISRNVIERGLDLIINTNTTVGYYYTSAIAVNTSCLIESNQISGSGNNTSPIVYIAGGSSIVSQNILSRNSTVSAYISVSNANDQIIKNNYFDSATVDSVNTNIVSGLTNTSTYVGNINQTGFYAASLLDYAPFIASSGTGSYSIPGGLSGSLTGPTSPNYTLYSDPTVSAGSSTFQINRALGTPGAGTTYVWIFDFLTTNSLKRNFNVSIPIDGLLPSGVKIVSATLGVYLQANGGSSPLVMNSQVDNQISLYLVSDLQTKSSTQNAADILQNVSLANSFQPAFDASTNIIDSYTVIVDNTGAGTSGSNYKVVSLSTITTATQYCTITPTLGQFVTGQGYRIYAEVDMNYWINATASPFQTTLNWYLSPIVIQYQW